MYKNLFLQIFALFTGKGLCWSLLNIAKFLRTPRPMLHTYKNQPTDLLWRRYFAVNFAKYLFDIYLIFNIYFLEYLWMAGFEIGNRNSRSSNHRCSVKQGVLGNFAKFTGKHLRQSLFFNKVARPATWLKKRLWRGSVRVNFCEISKNTFSTEHLRMTDCL